MPRPCRFMRFFVFNGKIPPQRFVAFGRTGICRKAQNRLARELRIPRQLFGLNRRCGQQNGGRYHRQQRFIHSHSFAAECGLHNKTKKRIIYIPSMRLSDSLGKPLLKESGFFSLPHDRPNLIFTAVLNDVHTQIAVTAHQQIHLPGRIFQGRIFSDGNGSCNGMFEFRFSHDISFLLIETTLNKNKV